MRKKVMAAVRSTDMATRKEKVTAIPTATQRMMTRERRSLPLPWPYTQP